MSGDLFERASRHFLAVCDLDPAERARYLDAELGGDASLRGEVERLLAAEERADSLLGENALEQVPRRASDAGHDVPGYSILGRIGAGAMGVVFEAEQDRTRRRVALKVIRGALFSEQALVRFQREIEVLGRLDHPGVARILAAGSDAEGNPFFAMERVDGAPLFEHARREGLDLRARLTLFAAICDAVDHVHAAGVVHRDLKSSNILVERAGTPRIVDFGVARLDGAGRGDESISPTLHGEVVGTLVTASPEQARGQVHEVDERSDVYALGAILYELLAERPPIEVRGLPLVDAVRQVCEEDPVMLGRLDPRLTGDLSVIAQKALEKRRERRYASAGALADDVRRHLEHRPISARRPSRAYRLGKLVQRNRSVFAGALAVLTALLIGLAVAILQAERASREALLLRRQAYLTAIVGAESALRQDDPATAKRLLAGAPAEERGWEWAYLAAQLDRAVAVLAPDAGGSGGTGVASFDAVGRLWTLSRAMVLQARDLALRPVGPAHTLPATMRAAFSPSGDVLAGLLRTEPQVAAVFDVASGRELGRVTLSVPARSIAVTDGGTRLFIGRREDGDGLGTVEMHAPLDAGAEVVAWRAPGSQHALLARPAGDGVYAAAIPMHLFRDGHPRPVTSPLRFYTGVGDLALSPAEPLLAVGTHDKRVVLVDPDDLTERGTLSGHGAGIEAVDFSPDGARLVSGSRDRLVRVWDVPRERLERTLFGHAAPVAGAAFARDGRRLASWDAAGELRIWDLAPTTSGGLLGAHGSFVYAVCHTPDGERILSGSWDGTIGVWDARGGERLGTLGRPAATRTPAVTALAISPDGAFVAAGAGAHEDAVLRVLRADTGTLLFELPAGQEVERLAWSPDGARLAFANDVRRIALVDVARARVAWEEPSPDGRPAHTAHLRFTADGGELVVCGPRTVRRYDVDTGRRTPWLDDLPTFRSAVFNDDLTRLVTGHPDGLVRIWNTRTGAIERELPGHVGAVYSVAYSPDGAYLASGSDDATVRLRDPRRGEDLLVLSEHDDYVYALSFAPDGAGLASGSGDGTVRLFDTRSVRERAAVRERRGELRAAADAEVAALSARLGDPDAVAEQLRADATRTYAEREAALQALLLRLQER